MNITEQDIDRAVESLRSGRWSMGETVKAFERVWAEWCGVEHALMVNSGSSANLLALSAFDVRPGDEVIVPAVCWSTCVSPIVQLGGTPVFVDVDLKTYNVTYEAVKKAISKKTKAIIVIHALGNPCKDISAIERLAVYEGGLFLLEDACEAHGATIRGRKVGSFGDYSTFSFFISHHLSTIEGGMICGDYPVDDLISMRAHGWIRDRSDREAWVQDGMDGDWVFVEPGYNVRPTEMQAAIGLSQMARLDQHIKERREKWVDMLTAFRDTGFFTPQRVEEGFSPFGFGMVCEDRRAMRQKALDLGFQTRPIIAGNFTRQPVMDKIPHRIAMPLTNADIIHDKGLMVGLG